MLLETATGSSRMSSDKLWISRLGEQETSIEFGRHFRVSCKLVCAFSANLSPCYPAILKGYLGRYSIAKTRAVNLQTTSQYSVNNGRASWQLFEPCKAIPANGDNHFYVNVLYKRVVITSESSAPPTLRTSTRVYLNHLIR
jgi:hypothetical protein